MTADPAPPFAAAVLAGGQSRRMGRDKALLSLNGRRLLDRQIDTLRALGPAELLLSGRPEVDYAVPGVRLVYDETPNQGPLAGIIAVLSATTAPSVVVLAVDMPAMTPDFLGRLLAAARPAAGAIARTAGHWEPLAAVYPRNLLLRTRRYWTDGGRALHPLIAAAVAAGELQAVETTASEVPLFANLNAPADLPTPP